MWATVAKFLGGPLIKKGFNWLMGRQENQKHANSLKAQWELAALKRSSTALRIISYLTLWGPLYYALYLAFGALPDEPTPQNVGDAVSAAIDAFPVWWTAAATTILLAVWGLKEKSVMDVEKAVADKEKARTEAARALQERKTEFFRGK